MNSSSSTTASKTFHLAIITGLFLVVFVSDFFTPLGFAHGILYTPVLVYALLCPAATRRFQLGLLVAAITCTLFYYAIAPNLSGLPNIYIFSNRMLSIAILILTYAYLKKLESLKKKNSEITELEQFQRKSLEDFINAMPIQVWAADASGNVDFASHSLEVFSGKRSAETLPDWLGLLHPDDRQRTMQTWTHCVQTLTPYQIEFRLRRRDGKYIWYKTQAVPQFNDQGEVIRWLGSSIDIDDLRRLQINSEQLAARFQHTIESITDAFFTLDHEFRFTYLNQKTADILGGTIDGFLGHVVWDKCGLGFESSFAQQYRHVAQTQEKVHFEDYFEPADKWLEVDVYPSTDGLTVYFSDVTERREMEQRLRESQRLEAVGHLTGGIAHDFNNLLTVILGNSEFLAESIKDPNLRPLAEMTMAASQRGAELTSRLLAFARRRPLNPKPTDINEVIQSMEPLLRRTVPEHIEMEFMLGSSLGVIEIDAGEFDAALLNLVVNARDAMESGGKLTIETTNSVLEQQYAARHPDVTPGEYVTVCVSDTGSGMTAETVKRAFEPFFTTKPTGKGSGLGLSMVFGFTKQSGGHLKIYSEVDEGTTIKLYFPIVNQAVQIEHQPTAADQPKAGKEHILITEDDDLVRQHLEGQLKLLGYRVTSSASGKEALALLVEHKDIDLLLTDVVMPGGMNGRELAAKAQELYPSLRILYTSGYTENAVVHHGRLDPGVTLLSKPYTRTELANKVRLVLDDSVDSTG